MRWLRTAITGKDNASTDIGRVLFAASVVVVLGLETWSVIAQHPFDIVSACGAIGGLLVCGGAGIAVKGHTEP